MSEASAVELKRFPKINVFAYIIGVICLAVIVYSFGGAGFNQDLDFKLILPATWEFLKELFPPDFSRISNLSGALAVTLKMAIAGTVIGVILSIPLGVFASSNFTPFLAIKFVARTLIALFRTIPDLIWAMFFVITVGLGPLAGTLAIVIDTMGFCGRFFAESIEECDKPSVEGLESLGASRLATIICAVFPSVLPSFTNTTLFSLEKAVRSSVILGLVGAGGIGIELKVAMDTFRYAEASTIIIAIFLMVVVVERLSSYIRSKLL